MRSRVSAVRLAASSLLFSLAALPAIAMEFATVPMGAECHQVSCPRAMIAEGEITGDAPQRFKRFLQGEMRTPGLHALLFINSPGGNVESALQLGAILHESGAAAVVGRPALRNGQLTAVPPKHRARAAMNVAPGQCASACVYTLMGAKRRVVPQGDHRPAGRCGHLDVHHGVGRAACARHLAARRSCAHRVNHHDPRYHPCRPRP